MKAVLILILAWCLAPVASASLAASADSAYSADDFPRAIDLYSRALAQDGPSPDLYYNLGNAYYRNGNLGRAIVAYNRCLRIDPANPDARANLAFVNSRIQDLPEDDSSFLTRLHTSIVTACRANAWAWTALGVFALTLAAVAIYVFGRGVLLRKVGFFGAFVLAAVCGYFIMVAADAASRLHDHSHAVVTVPTTFLNSIPRQPKQTDKVVPLHEGTKVQIIDSVPTPDDPVSPRWYNVKINNSTLAWLRGTDVERI